MITRTHPWRRDATMALTWATLAFVCLGIPLHSLADQRPNIVLIVLDDAGYSDLGVFGGEIRTPNIDRLADGGVQFTQFHVTPNCSSTRASLLTGMDHHRTGLGTHAVTAKNQQGKPGYEGYLNERVITLPEVLQSAGYRTMMAGKWHLGSKDTATWPSARGFDDSFSLLNGGASHWQDNNPLLPSKPSRYVKNGELLRTLPHGFYSSDYYTDQILESIGNTEQPFFAYLSFTAPHNPLHAPAESFQRYEQTFLEGWDAMQLRRLERLKSLGLVPKDVRPQPRPDWIPPWESLSETEKQLAARDMAIYAGMIDRLDQNVGRLVARLKAQQKYGNTLIMVMSDNGPSKTTTADYVELDGRGQDFLKQFNNTLENRGLSGSNVDLGPGWAYGLAAPFRLMKGYQSQGGVLSPLIVKQPIGWQTDDQESLVTVPVHVMDLMPTMLEAARTKHPTEESPSLALSMQGMCLRTLMQGGDPTPFEQRGFGGELFGMRSYRRGRWKAIKLPPPYGTDKWQLYDLSRDPGETIDVSANHPGELDRLVVLWANYAKTNGVVEPDEPVAYAKPPK